jgi:predicted glycosyltransferase
MLEHRARLHEVRERSVFVGDPDDIVDARFGAGLPEIRRWTEQNFDFAGYVTGFVPPTEEQRATHRARLGLHDGERLCVVTVGGSGVGGSLLRRVLDAVPAARRREDGLRFLVVAGPRIDPATLPGYDGVEIVGYQPDLTDTLAAADIAVVQGGLTTCMELTACRTPFVYVPLRHHFEQNYHVRHRLERYRAGRLLPYESAEDPDALAAAVSAELARDVDYLPVQTDGAARAARLLADLF